jgi:MFS family permease
MAGTSFPADYGHEAQSTILPTFMGALGLPPAALGAVEGVADAASSFVKLGAGWLSDRVGRRKPFVVLGYLVTGLASGIIALATGFPLILAGKLFGWLGRAIRRGTLATMRFVRFALLLAVSGCVHLPPYRGAALAHPTMSPGSLDTEMARRVGERSECARGRSGAASER